jgi:hypothetical protein
MRVAITSMLVPQTTSGINAVSRLSGWIVWPQGLAKLKDLVDDPRGCRKARGSRGRGLERRSVDRVPEQDPAKKVPLPKSPRAERFEGFLHCGRSEKWESRVEPTIPWPLRIGAERSMRWTIESFSTRRPEDTEGRGDFFLVAITSPRSSALSSLRVEKDSTYPLTLNLLISDEKPAAAEMPFPRRSVFGRGAKEHPGKTGVFSAEEIVRPAAAASGRLRSRPSRGRVFLARSSACSGCFRIEVG